MIINQKHLVSMKIFFKLSSCISYAFNGFQTLHSNIITNMYWLYVKLYILKLMKNINVTFPPHWPYKTVYITTELSYRQGDLKTNTTHLVSTNGNKKIPHSFKIESSIVETELKLLPHARTHARTHAHTDRQTDRQTDTHATTHPSTHNQLILWDGATQQWTSKHRIFHLRKLHRRRSHGRRINFSKCFQHRNSLSFNDLLVTFKTNEQHTMYIGLYIKFYTILPHSPNL